MEPRDPNDAIADPATQPRSDANPRLAALGMFKGQIWIADDFDAPLSEEELRLWYEGDVFPPAGDDVRR